MSSVEYKFTTVAGSGIHPVTPVETKAEPRGEKKRRVREVVVRTVRSLAKSIVRSAKASQARQAHPHSHKAIRGRQRLSRVSRGGASRRSRCAGRAERRGRRRRPTRRNNVGRGKRVSVRPITPPPLFVQPRSTPALLRVPRSTPPVLVLGVGGRSKRRRPRSAFLIY